MAYGVPEVDLFQGSDLFEGRNLERVTRTVQAVAREVREQELSPSQNQGRTQNFLRVAHYLTWIQGNPSKKAKTKKHNHHKNILDFLPRLSHTSPLTRIPGLACGSMLGLRASMTGLTKYRQVVEGAM